jgi:hypothetical protein
MVEAVKLARLHLHNPGLFCGAQTIVWELEEMGLEDHPSVRTINRILNREELTHRQTGRYESKGRKYPKLSAQGAKQWTYPCNAHRVVSLSARPPLLAGSKFAGKPARVREK